jgi:hypothetical protein
MYSSMMAVSTSRSRGLTRASGIFPLPVRAYPALRNPWRIPARPAQALYFLAFIPDKWRGSPVQF